MAELATIRWDSLGTSVPLSFRKPFTGRRLTFRAWAGEAWRSSLLPRLYLYRGYRGFEPQGDGWEEWSVYRYESCWKLDASWLGWGFELMPTFQGRLMYASGVPV